MNLEVGRRAELSACLYGWTGSDIGVAGPAFGIDQLAAIWRRL